MLFVNLTLCATATTSPRTIADAIEVKKAELADLQAKREGHFGLSVAHRAMAQSATRKNIEAGFVSLKTALPQATCSFQSYTLRSAHNPKGEDDRPQWTAVHVLRFIRRERDTVTAPLTVLCVVNLLLVRELTIFLLGVC